MGLGSILGGLLRDCSYCYGIWGGGGGMLVVEQFESLAVFGVATVDFGLPNTPWRMDGWRRQLIVADGLGYSPNIMETF